MDRVAVRVLGPLALGIAEKRHIVGWRGIRVNVLEPDVHGSHRNRSVLETREQVEQMMWCQSQFRWLDCGRGEGQ